MTNSEDRSADDGDKSPRLARRLNLVLLTLYGLGTTVGAGIYVLVGKVAGRAGLYAPVSFILAALLAAFTAAAYAELSARYPRSAGEAVYVREGFGRPGLATIVGGLVVITGTISSAALVVGFAGYFGQLITVPASVATIGLVVVLALLAIWGISESVTIAATVTVVEVGGLLLVVWAGRDALSDPSMAFELLTPAFDMSIWTGIVAGSFLAFFAFIGFEDMVNVAEEVKNPTRTLPRAIVLTLIVTTVLYVAVAMVAVATLVPSELALADAPLVAVYERASAGDGTVIVMIGTLAVVNGALIQVIMASRVIYGMAAQGWLPGALARINRRTRTPVLASTAVSGVVLGLALLFDVERLAEATTMVTLAVFTTINASLVRIKLRHSGDHAPLTLPLWVPIIGTAVSGLFLILTAINLVVEG